MRQATQLIPFKVEDLQLFVNIVPDAAVICDDDGHILCANDQACRLFRAPEDKLQSDALLLHVPELSQGSRQGHFVESVRRGDLDRDLQVLLPDGHSIDVWFSTSRLRGGREDSYLVLVTMRDVTERLQQRENLHRLSVTDEVTGLFNRRHLRSVGMVELERACRYNLMPVCVFVDIDHFKELNDEHGHAVGDRALAAVADRLVSTVRKVDLVCRYGGDEFVVLALVPSVEGAHSLASRIKDAASTIEEIEGLPVKLTLSCGAIYSAHPALVELDELLDRADRLMLEAKRSGRDRHFVASFE
jgi:diguanylate cyclase (GGDEF)-like protein/PAS domain S-box-containing protein